MSPPSRAPAGRGSSPDPAATAFIARRKAAVEMGLIGEFTLHQRRRNLSPNTIHHRRGGLIAFENWLVAHQLGTLLDASPDDVNRWLDSLSITPDTRYSYLGYLRAFYRWALRDDLVLFNVIDKIDAPKRAKRLPRPIDSDELQLAIEYADPRMYAWLHLIAYQGFRCMEVAALRTEDIDRLTMSLRVHGKGDKEGVLPLHPQVLAALVAYGIPVAGFVFTKRSGNPTSPLSPATVSRYIGAYLHSLGSEATAHRGRHWYGTSIHRLTGDLLVTRDLLRHSSSRTSELYAQVTANRGRDIISQLAV